MATYLVTGANRGIGLEYCRQIKARGDRAIAVCRGSSPELDGLGIQVETGVDITSDQSVAALVNKFKDEPIDVLINNAGILKRVTLDDLDFNNIQQQFEVNAIGTLHFTAAFLPVLSNNAKVIIMTSRMVAIVDNTSGGSYGYRMSKVAVSMAGKSLAVDLKPQGIAVAILHPGLVQTRMTNFTKNGITSETSVTGLLARIDELSLETTGSFWHASGEILPW